MPGIILIVVALMYGAISGVFHRLPNQSAVTGEIVSIEREKTLDSGSTMYTAYVEYYVNGMAYTIKSGYRSSVFYTGQKMRVVYNRKSPQQAILRPGLKTYVAVLGLLVAGMIVCYYTLFE